MENNQAVTLNASDALKHVKLMNKLGASFFILFLIFINKSFLIEKKKTIIAVFF